MAGAVVLASCSAASGVPDLGRIYDEAAKVHDLHRNPVIVIPGVLGSELTDRGTKTVVWGAFSGNYAHPRRPEGARLVALPMGEGRDLAELRDDVTPTGVLERVRVPMFGLPLGMNAYVNILATLGVGNYHDESLGLSGAIDYGDEHFTCFQFPYDWRRDLVESARELHRFILEKRAYVEREMEARFGIRDAEVKFDIVAHSMGGLLARYYLRYGDADLVDDGSVPQPTWAGAELVERAILVAPPNAGSAEACQNLVEGVRFSFLLPTYPAAILGTMPSIYQVLPRSRHRMLEWAGGDPVEDVFSPELWESMGWGLADPDQADVLEQLLPGVPEAPQRRRIALDHQRKCLERARRFTEALDVPASPPDGLDLHLFAGDAVQTPALLEIEPGSGEVCVRDYAPGDGTVLRSSALMDERVGRDWTPKVDSPIRWSQVYFLFTDHLCLTKDPTLTDNVLYLLLEAPR